MRHRTLVPWISWLFLTTGCVSLFDASRHQAALDAQKAIAEAKIDQSLADERVQHQQISAHELEVAEQQLLSWRNAELLNVIESADSGAARDRLQRAIEKRLDQLQGPPDRADMVGRLIDLEAAEAAVERRAALYRIAGPARTDPALSCTDAMPSFSSALLQQVWASYQAECVKLQAARNAVAAARQQAGELSTVEARLADAASLEEDITAHLGELSSKYKKLAAELNARRKAGQPVDLSKQASSVAVTLAKIQLPSEQKLGESGLADLKGRIALEWIDTQRDAIVRVLQAAAGPPSEDVPSEVDGDLQLAALLPSIGEELQRGFKYPRVTSLVHEWTRLGLERDATQVQVARAEQQIALLHEKRDAMQRELTLLIEARAALAESATRCTDLQTFDSFRKPTGRCGQVLRRALNAFSEAWTLGRIPEVRVEWQLTQLDHERALDAGALALREWNALLSVQMDALVASHATGVKPEQIGKVIDSIGFGAIASVVP